MQTKMFRLRSKIWYSHEKGYHKVSRSKLDNWNTLGIVLSTRNALLKPQLVAFSLFAKNMFFHKLPVAKRITHISRLPFISFSNVADTKI